MEGVASCRFDDGRWASVVAALRGPFRLPCTCWGPADVSRFEHLWECKESEVLGWENGPLPRPRPDCHRREGVAPSVWLPVVQTHFSFPPAPFLKLMKPWLKKASSHQPGRHPGRPRLAPSDRLSDSSFPNATATEITPLNELLSLPRSLNVST